MSFSQISCLGSKKSFALAITLQPNHPLAGPGANSGNRQSYKHNIYTYKAQIGIARVQQGSDFRLGSCGSRVSDTNYRF